MARLQDSSQQNQSAARGRGRPSIGEEGKSPRLQVRLPEELLAQVLELADRQQVKKSQILRDALTAYLGHPCTSSHTSKDRKVS
jgi:Arc/MetJ family transcription regulator